MCSTSVVLQLINFVKPRRYLYDKNDPQYNKKELHKQAFSELSQKLRVPERHLRKRWSTLRYEFYKKMKYAELLKRLRKPPTKEGKWTKHLMFLYNTNFDTSIRKRNIVPRRAKANVSPPSLDALKDYLFDSENGSGDEEKNEEYFDGQYLSRLLTANNSEGDITMTDLSNDTRDFLTPNPEGDTNISGSESIHDFLYINSIHNPGDSLTSEIDVDSKEIQIFDPFDLTNDNVEEVFLKPESILETRDELYVPPEFVTENNNVIIENSAIHLFFAGLTKQTEDANLSPVAFAKLQVNLMKVFNQEIYNIT